MSRARNILVILAVVASWSMVGAPSASATSCPNTEVQASGLTQDQMESSLACLINEQRSSYDLQPVQPNSQLRQAAVSHSQEMVAQSYFEHTSPAGLTFIDRIQQTGYMRGASSWIVGENLVWGSVQLSTPASMVNAWMNSPPHRENLLRARFNEIGIASVTGTPESAADTDGVTVSSEYGSRTFGNRAHSSKAKAKAKSRKAKVRKVRKHNRRRSR